MKPLEDHLVQYAASHRDRRNIATHFVGIPLIVFSVVLALDTLTAAVGPFTVSAAAAASLAAAAYYVRLDAGLGLAMALVLFAMCAGASEITARAGTAPALAIGAATFVAGWALQLWGHRFEGVKPAFLDDARQLLIGPLFVCAEACFLFGGRPSLRRHIESRVGPTLARRDGAPLAGSP